MNDETSVKSIADVIKHNHHFLVEDYQRGYKWSKTEVEQLLNDISEFDGNGFYCLQPVVVKKVTDKGEEKVELIDGQQRLTTIYIILSFLIKEKFHIEYRTRGSSQRFLEGIKDIVEGKDWSDFSNTKEDNIDNFHFFQAYQTVKIWFQDETQNKKVDKEEFWIKLLDKVRVIWYEVPNDTQNSKPYSIKTFTRINSGKIPLTNGELIKALFLINVADAENNEVLQLKQNEVAQQWDTFEYALQVDAFWYFLSNDSPPATRIDLIFDLIV